MSDTGYFAGTLMVALPAIGDPRFAHAVVALVHHDARGAMGVGVATRTDMQMTEVFETAGIAGCITPDQSHDHPVLMGGPVEPERGFLLHSLDWAATDGPGDVIDVDGQYGFSGSIDVLRAIADGAGPRDWLLALGYAGWGPGQLEDEIAADAWHVSRMRFADWFAIPAGDRWAALLAHDGIVPGRIAVQGGTA